MSTAYKVGAGVGIFLIRDGMLLLQKRTGAHGEGTWAPPGGKIEHSEDPQDTAIRETKEESGLSISSPHYLGFTNDVFEKEGLHYITLWYATDSFQGEAVIMEPEKFTEQKWVTLNELPTPLFLSTDHALADQNIRKLLEDILKGAHK